MSHIAVYCWELSTSIMFAYRDITVVFFALSYTQKYYYAMCNYNSLDPPPYDIFSPQTYRGWAVQVFMLDE